MATSIKAFRGLQNVSDPLRLGLGWLAQADNLDITDTGALIKRGGYRRVLTDAITSAFATVDHARMYLVDGAGNLKTMARQNSAVTLKTGLAVSSPMQWAEVNDQVYFTNGTDSGVIEPDNTVLPWAWTVPGDPTLVAVTGQLSAGLYRACITYTLPDGRMTGAGGMSELVLPEGSALQVTNIASPTGLRSNVYLAPADSTVFQLAVSTTGNTFVWSASPDTLGTDLLNAQLDPLPLGTTAIQAWRSRLYAGQYLAQAGQSVVWFSQPLGFHLFDLDTDFVQVPGRITMLAPHPDALIIGTDTRIYAYDGQALVQLAAYGALPGQHWAIDGARTLFWSQRGLCVALPFANLTEARVSFPPGASAGGALIEQDGQRRYVACVRQSAEPAFNPRS